MSINSRTAVHVIYSSAQCFNKSDAYDLHMKGEGVFFIKERERHAARRRPWNQALSAKTIPNYYEQLFRTTHQFVECLAEHTKEKGSIDFVRYASQWAFDSMVRLSCPARQTHANRFAGSHNLRWQRLRRGASPLYVW